MCSDQQRAGNGAEANGIRNASKAAVRSLVRTVTAEPKARGIRVGASRRDDDSLRDNLPGRTCRGGL